MDKMKIEICIGSACFARGNARNVEAAEKYLKARGCRDSVDLEIKGRLCSGCCADGPNVIINDEIYHQVTPERMVELLDQSFGEKSGKKS